MIAWYTSYKRFEKRIIVIGCDKGEGPDFSSMVEIFKKEGGGTGVWKNYQYEFGQRYLIGTDKCWNCNEGIYSTHSYYLKRYILNGVLYHIPSFDNPQQPIVNVIEGIIGHKEIPSEKALKSFLILCAVYNKQLLRDLAVRYMKEKYQYSLLQSLLSGRFKEEELPF